MATKDKNISSKQKRAIAALITAPDYKAAAELAGIGYRTGNRWMVDDLFVVELRRAEGEIIASAVRSLISDLAKNIETIKKIRDSERIPDVVRLRAAQVIDQSLLKWREALDIEQRLEALEKVILDGKS